MTCWFPPKAFIKTYLLGKRTLEVLRGVDLELDRGDFLALRGASGAGKSTLLYLLGGLDTPNAGEIRLAGRNLATLSRRELARAAQPRGRLHFPGLLSLAGAGCLGKRVPARANGPHCPAARVEARGRELLARVGLAERMEHKPYEFRGGEQQRVAIARALINEPDLILADEPTGNLDSHTGEEIIDLLVTLRGEKHTTLVMATHDARVAARAPRVIELVDGTVV